MSTSARRPAAGTAVTRPATTTAVRAPTLTSRRAAPVQTGRKDTILLAAERLFAQRGYHAVSIRQIAEEAGVPLALVGYYFGQKHELFAAIFQHWSTTIDERLAGLRAAVQAGGDQLLRHIVEAFVNPVLRLRASPEGEFYALLVARELAYASPEADEVLRRHFDPMAHAFVDALQGALPGSTPADAAWGYQFALGALLHHLSDHRVERLSRGSARANDPQARDRLLDFIEGGLRATRTSAPPRRARSPATTTTSTTTITTTRRPR